MSLKCTFRAAFTRLRRIIPGAALHILWGALILAPKGTASPAGANAPLYSTGRESNLAIQGPGWFSVIDEGGISYSTRFGNFLTDSYGYLVTPNGERVQGLTSDLVTVGSVRIFDDVFNRPNPDSDPSARIAGFNILSDGWVRIRLSNGEEFYCGRILLRAAPPAPDAVPLPGSLLADRDLGTLPTLVPPGENGIGTITSGWLESPLPHLEIFGTADGQDPFANPILASSYIETDLAIHGRGFFILRDPVTGAEFATRVGLFYWNPDGYLVNYAGLRVQGHLFEQDEIGDVRAIWTGQLPLNDFEAKLFQRRIGRAGVVTGRMTDGTEFIAARILLRDCTRPQALAKKPLGLYPIDSSTGSWTDYASPARNGFGFIHAGLVDRSQLDEEIVATRRRMNFFIRGSFIFTDHPADCYIDGQEGFFVVRDPETNRLLATRNGHFHLDDDHRLVTPQGYRVQGISGASYKDALLPANPPTIDGADIVINDVGLPRTDQSEPAWISTFGIRADGRIRVSMTDGMEFDRGQILLQRFANPHALHSEGHHLYSNLENALPQCGPIGVVPGDQGTGTIISGALEDIWVAPDLQVPPRNAVRLSAKDLPWGGYLEASTDFNTWQPLGEIGGMFADTDFFDQEAAPRARFYRIRAYQPRNPDLFEFVPSIQFGFGQLLPTAQTQPQM